jgi:hypothetical protein
VGPDARPASSSERESRIPCSGLATHSPPRDPAALLAISSRFRPQLQVRIEESFGFRKRSALGAEVQHDPCGHESEGLVELGAAGDALFGGLGPEARGGVLRPERQRFDEDPVPLAAVAEPPRNPSLQGDAGRRAWALLAAPASRLRPEAGKGTSFAPSAKPLAPPIR